MEETPSSFLLSSVCSRGLEHPGSDQVLNFVCFEKPESSSQSPVTGNRILLHLNTRSRFLNEADNDLYG